MSEAQLKLGGYIYSGWTGLKVQRGIEQASGAFALKLTDRWQQKLQNNPIELGKECSVLLDDLPVITGYVERIEENFDAHSHAVKVTGRDRVGDIIDCTALLNGDKTSSLKNKSLLQIAEILCKPYSIIAVDKVGINSPFNQWAIQPYETVWENLARAAKQKAALLMSDGLGGLLITRAGHTVNPNFIVEGENVLSAELLRSDSQRHNRYIIRGQGPGSDNASIESFLHPEATIDDSVISRERPMVFQCEDIAETISMRDRVRWVRNIRRAKSRHVTVTVQGWSANSKVWEPNELVSVSIPTLGIEGQLLIVSVIQTLDQGGSLTELLLSRKENYELLPEDVEQNSNTGISKETLKLLR